jgi:hypothetical protein
MEIQDEIKELYPDALVMDGFDDCIEGMCFQYGKPPVIAYNKQKVLQKLMDGGIETLEGAEEYFEFNQLGAYVGEHTPVFIETFQKE